MKNTIIKILIFTSVVAFTGCGVDGGGGGSSRNLDINLEKGVRLVKETRKDLKYNSTTTTTYEYDTLSRLETKTIIDDTSRSVSKFSYYGDTFSDKKILSNTYDKNGNKVGYVKIESEVDQHHRLKKLTTTVKERNQHTLHVSTTTKYKNDHIDLADQLETKIYFDSTLTESSTAKYTYSKDKTDKVELITKQPNDTIIEETNNTFGYDSLNRLKYEKTISSLGTTDEYISTYSKNTKTAQPSCYIGNRLKINRKKFKKFPRGRRICYLMSSHTNIHTEGKVKKESVSNFEYKINDKNLVTEIKSGRFISTYEYEEYENN